MCGIQQLDFWEHSSFWHKLSTLCQPTDRSIFVWGCCITMQLPQKHMNLRDSEFQTRDISSNWFCHLLFQIPVGFKREINLPSLNLKIARYLMIIHPIRHRIITQPCTLHFISLSAGINSEIIFVYLFNCNAINSKQ